MMACRANGSELGVDRRRRIDLSDAVRQVSTCFVWRTGDFSSVRYRTEIALCNPHHGVARVLDVIGGRRPAISVYRFAEEN